MDHDEIAYLRSRSPAWRLLRADTAPLVLAALGRIFVVDNVRSMAQSDLVAAVDDLLHALAAGLGPDEELAYPRSARDYVLTWASPEHGWLRSYYPEGSGEAHYDATSDFEKAYGWVVGLRARGFVGTESRLHTVIDLLRQIVHGAQQDPAGRLAELRRRRQELDDLIAQAEAGQSAPMDSAALRDRYQHFAATARELLADFREVEENFRALDRGAREQIAAWDGSKGELLERLVGDRHAIAASEQGRSFQAFHDFLLSRSRQDELGALLDALADLDTLAVDRRMRHIHHDWLDAAERTQHTVRSLSEQLRRFLDDKVWLENRRVMDLLRSIERGALAARGTSADGLTMTLEAVAPRLRLPMERPMYAPAPPAALDTFAVGDARDEIDAQSLFEQEYVDTGRLAATVRRALRGREQVTLSEVLATHPPELGLAEIVAYLAMNEDDFDVIIDQETTCRVEFVDAAGAARALRMPVVTLVRHRAAAGSGGRR